MFVTVGAPIPVDPVIVSCLAPIIVIACVGHTAVTVPDSKCPITTCPPPSDGYVCSPCYTNASRVRPPDPPLPALRFLLFFVLIRMLQLVAENAALEDGLYYLDVGVTDGAVSVEVFLKEVRKLARRQFVARATAKKVGE